MASRRHTYAGGGGGAEHQPLLSGGGSIGVASAAGGMSAPRGAGVAVASPSSYGSGGQHKALTDEPPDLATFQQASSMYHLPGSRRRSSWVYVEKPPTSTIDILRRTRRHRLDLAVLLLASFAFISAAIILPSGWTLGHIVTTSVLMPEAVKCPGALPGADDPTSKCEASKILVYNSKINYGLFGRLKYVTNADASVHTQLKTADGHTAASLAKTSNVVSSEIQDSYRYWGENFPGPMLRVRATQALVLFAWASSLLSLLLLALISFRQPASKLATTTTMRVGCGGLLASAVALAAALACWLSIPLSAFSTVCAPTPAADAGPAATALGALACVQLDGAFCEDNCHVDNQLVRTGSTGFGLVLFSALLQCVCAGFWHKLEEDVSEACDHPRQQQQASPPQRRPSPVFAHGVLNHDHFHHLDHR